MKAAPRRPTLVNKVGLGRRNFSCSTAFSVLARQTQLPSKSVDSRSEWPVEVLLKEAVQSGYLHISVQTAIQILKAFRAQGTLSAEQICISHSVKPNILTALAKILTYSGHKEPTARDLLVASARLGDDEAILLVIKEAIKLRNLATPKSVAIIYQRRFQPLVQRKHPAAIYLEGQKYESEGQRGHALKLYESVVTANADPFDTIGGINGADIWKAIGKLRVMNGDRRGAEAAISAAALQYDDPAALFQLAKTFTSPSLADYESLMLKAAASGEAKAAHELGLLYLKQSQGKISVVDRIHSSEPKGNNASGPAQSSGRGQRYKEDSAAAKQKRLEAREWFHVGAESGIIGSQVYLALLLREFGKLEDGRQWLLSAGKREDVYSKENQAPWAEVIEYFVTRWDDSDENLESIDVDKIRRGGRKHAN